VSLSIATQRGSLPIAWQLYVPKEWIDDRERARRAGIPDDLVFEPRPQIALAQLREAIASGVAPGILLADAGYGDETAFRDGVTELGLLYAVGIRPGTSVWAPGTVPLPPKPWSGRGKPPTFGLGHYEGRGWRGFHHHATLSTTAYEFLMAQRLRMQPDGRDKKTSLNARCLPFPRITSPGAVQRAQRHVPDSITTLRILLGQRLMQRWLSSCTATERATSYMTQSD